MTDYTTNYVTELEKRVDEQQKKLAVYEEVVGILLPLVCKSEIQFEADMAWLDSIALRLTNTIGNSELQYHDKVTRNSAQFKLACGKAFIECSKKLKTIKHKP